MPQQTGRKRQDSSPIIAGIGASAGGLEAVRELLQALGEKPGFALAYVQHQAPDNGTLLPELLHKATLMPVVAIEDRLSIEPNTLYVATPHTVTRIENGRFRVGDPKAPVQVSATALSPEHASGSASPVSEYLSAANNDTATSAGLIDGFLHSLAEHVGERAIGIILSGAGSDGTLGLKSISDAGGLSFAQSAESARFDSMPRQASVTGVADHVLAPAAMAAELHRYVQHLQSIDSPAHQGQREQRVHEAISQVAEILLGATGHNFQHYKPSTLSRRIQRRMQIRKIVDMTEYLGVLERESDESAALFRELLIGVTAFFRDPDVFAELKSQVLPDLFKNRTGSDQVRLWVPGCATGQEAYTLAMLCQEQIDECEDPPEVQIFATDIDTRALAIARLGQYPLSVADEIGSERLDRFFIKRGARYHVCPSLRERVLFSGHNLINDPPFSNQDLISCRNLLIYLGDHLQKKLIPLFHYALRPNGYLLLGPSENIAAHGELFREVSARHRLSQRKGTAVGSTASASQQRHANPAGPRLDRHPPSTDAASPNISELMQRIVLDEFAPKSVVVDETGKILCASADMQKYLSVAAGQFENNVIKMARTGLRMGLRAALKEAAKVRRQVRHENLSVRTEGQVQQVMLTVQPMPELGIESALYMVVFHDVGLPYRRGDPDATVPDLEHSPYAMASDDSEAIIAQLERELATTREDLERTLQEMEAGNEELKSSNEELLSMNEELQSTNEELETSKEEIQAGSDALARSHSDLNNLLQSTGIATIFLDEQGNIRRFTPAARSLYGLIDTDIGRPLEQLVAFSNDMPNLPPVDDVYADSVEAATLRTQDGRLWVRQARPYRTHRGACDGIVLIFSDMTEQLHSEAMLRRSLSAARMDAFQVDLNQHRVNRQGVLWQRLGLHDAGSAGDHLAQVHEADRIAMQAAFENASPEAPHYAVTYRFQGDDGQTLWLREDAEVLFDHHGKAIEVLGSCRDVTDEWQARQALEASEHQRELALSTGGLGLWVWYIDTDRVEWTDSLYQLLGVAPEQFDHNLEGFSALIHPDDQDSVMANIQRLLDGTDNRYRFEARMRHGNSHWVWIAGSGHAERDASGRVIRMTGAVGDVTQRKQAELALSDREAHLRRVINNQLGLVGLIDRQGVLLEVDDRSLSIAGLARDDVIGRPFADCPWWTYEPAVQQRMRQAMAQAFDGQVVRYDERLYSATGEPLMIDFMLAPVFDGDGLIEYLVSSGVDISKRKSTERALQASELRLQLAADLARLGIGEVDYLNDTIRLTESAARLYGFGETAREISRSVMHQRFHPDDAADLKSAIARCLASDSQGAMAVEHRISLPDGSVRWLDVRKQVYFALNEAGERHARSAVLVARDISDRKADQERLLESEGRFRSMVDGLPQLIWVHDTQGAQEQVNVAFCDFFGVDKQNMLDMQWQSLIHPDDFKPYTEEFARCLAAREPFMAEVRVRRHDGQWRWLDSRGLPRYTGSGEYLGFVGASVDVSERKQTQIELQQALGSFETSNAQLQAFFSASSFFCAVLDIEGKVLQVNDAASRALGYERDAIVGEPLWKGPWWTDLPTSQEQLNQLLKQVQSGYSSAARVIEFRTAAAELRQADVTLSPASSHDGTLLYIVATGIDITEQRRFEDTLKEARRLADVANEAKSAFVANMSHEIRTPMAAVLGYADLLALNETDVEKAQYLQTIKRNGQFLLDIINDILDISKIEAGRLEVSREPMAPHDTVADVMSMMDVRSSDKSLSFNVQYRNPIPEVIEGDAKRLKQILINLVGNAIKFTQEGGVQLVISYDEADTQCLHFEIIDTGIGLSPEQQRQLFEPFAQGDASVTRNFGGTGLGLAISQRLATLMGGRISVRSKPGQGSCFTLTIPVGNVGDVALIEPGDVSPISHVNANAALPVLDCHVLVADDRPDVRGLVRRFLENAAATVVTACDGQEVIEQIKAALDNRRPMPDLILLDMQMPRVDGYQAATRLRQMGYACPIIALTADVMQGDMNLCLQSGCDAFLAKPIDARHLIETIATYTQVPADELEGARAEALDETAPGLSGPTGVSTPRVGKADAPGDARPTPRVLVVDDARDVCRALQKLLGMKGFDAQVEHTGANAVALAARESFEVFILDISLEDMSGLELVATINALPDRHDALFIALSGHSSAEDAQQSLQAGFDYHLTKPADVQQLLTVIDEGLSARQWRP